MIKEQIYNAFEYVLMLGRWIHIKYRGFAYLLFNKMFVYGKKLEACGYKGTVSLFKQNISERIEFDFSVSWEYPIGFFIQDNSSDDRLPVSVCWEVIEGKGILTYKDFKKEVVKWKKESADGC